jgi:hypothetical protein
VELGLDPALHYDVMRAAKILPDTPNATFEKSALIFRQCMSARELRGTRYEAPKERRIELSSRFFLMVDNEAKARNVSISEAVEGLLSEIAMRSRRKAAKKATAVGADKPAVTGFGAGLESAHPAVEPVVRRQPDEAQPEQGSCGAEEIRELVVERVPQNPRLVLASYTVDGRKEIVRVWVGVNRNFRPWMKLGRSAGY